ncbi:IS110 family transposase [Leisingera sp. NJS201]|nr:IS110 family transposase [Leisingera sp. NJS201]
MRRDLATRQPAACRDPNRFAFEIVTVFGCHFRSPLWRALLAENRNKSEAGPHQAHAMLFRTRQMPVGQRTQVINALRGHLAEFGMIAPNGRVHLKALAEALACDDADMPEMGRELGHQFLEQVATLDIHIARLEEKTRAASKSSKTLRRLQTAPGVGPVTALAIEAFAPDMSGFRCRRDFSAWVGLVPRQHSSGGKSRLGRTSKMGQRDIRKLLIIGAMAVVRAALRHGAAKDSWLARMLGRKPRMLVAIAVASKMARSIWAMLTKDEDYRNPAVAA